MGVIPRLVLLFVFFSGLSVGFGTTDPQDAAALQSLVSEWQNTPPNWGQSNDPCGLPWDGIVCDKNSRVIMLRLPGLSIAGMLSGDIGQLTKLQSLDLSSNPDLGGPLTPNIGNLLQLTTLILTGCGFSGNIPQELGNLPLLSFVDLNSNKFSGPLPASMGKLSKLYWLDLGNNQFSGPLPISNNKSPGLDLLLNAKHFHFNKNQFSGTIPEALFSPQMQLLHILFDSNNFTGEIPASIGLVQSLEILRLDRNSLTGPVPTNITNLTSLNELNLANNKLSGPFPELKGMNSLTNVDLSNNTFDASQAPDWFSTLKSLTVLVVESGGLIGDIPQKLFSFPGLEQVVLKHNAFSGTLSMGNTISKQLQTVDFQNNSISSVTLSAFYNNTLLLIGNPVCSANSQLANSPYCLPQKPPQPPYSTSLSKCGSTACNPDQSIRPLTCDCAYPYQGVLIFRAPAFQDVTNATRFQQLEMSLWTTLDLSPGLVYIADPTFNGDVYLRVDVKIFPSSGTSFNRQDIIRIGSLLSNQTFQPPPGFGPYQFIAYQYFTDGNNGGSKMSTGAIAGIAVGCAVLIVVLLVVGIYAFKQKKRAERAVELSKPFASWAPAGKEAGGAPQLKGSRWFSFDELKKSTNNFSESNEIGSGGYGKVYQGTLLDGQMVAIKRAQQGSMQGGLEFKTEIELLSRVHHKNLVGLVGFCFEQEQQMLVYEFIPNGTLRENLMGRSGIQLDWKRRLRVALGSARGLAYLHELADPPIIHRDIKSTNILLDANLNAKVADFGLSKLVADAGKGHVSTQVKGTLGYLDPEYYMTQQLTEKSDVYSFGVVMLELISARQPIEKGKYIVREVRTAMDGNDHHYGLTEIMDPAIRNAPNLPGFRRFVELAMQCVEESASSRPTMNEVVKEIETMLQNEGLFSNSISSSQATESGNKNGSTDLYSEMVTMRKNDNSDAFEYSGGQSFVPVIEPK